MSKYFMLLFFVGILISCSQKEYDDGVSEITLIVNDSETKSASVTGKELLWGRTQIKRKNILGSITFIASVNDADLIQIKVNNSYNYFNCYLEEKQKLNVVYENHQYCVTGDNIAARQNRLLLDIDKHRKNILSNTTDSTKLIQAHKLYMEVDKLIANFANRNRDASNGFIKFVRFDNRYFYLKQLTDKFRTQIDPRGALHADKLQLLYNTIRDSGYELAYLSPNYRLLLNDYFDYVRANDSVYLAQTSINPIENERIWANMLKSSELRHYQMASSIRKLMYFDYQHNLQKDIRKHTGYWQHFLQEEYQLISDRNKTGIEVK